MIFVADMKSKNKINLTRAISTYADYRELGELTKQLYDIQVNKVIA